MGKAKAPPRKVEPLPRGKVQERKKENRSAALGDAVRFLSFAESVGWAFPACSRNEVRREACPFSAEYRGKEKPRSMVTHGEVFFSSFSAGKHSGLSPKYEILRLACHCERAEHRPSAGTWQAKLFRRVACLAPLLRRHGPHSARAGAAFLRPLVRHARRAVGCVSAWHQVHRAAHAGDDVCAFPGPKS
jgi:hypothetical protein